MIPPLRSTTPCARRWDDLVGDGPTRFCTECDRMVHDLDALSDAGIDAVRQANPNGFCATFLHAGDGVFRRPSQARTATLAAAVVAAVVGCSTPSDVSAPGTATPEVGAAATKTDEASERATPAPADRQLDPETQERLRALGGYV